MPSLQTLVLAFSLSGDAFAASLAKGARYSAMPLWRAFAIALGFGTLEALAPIIGFMLGLQFADTIASVDHWIAFTLLALIGARMIYRGFFPAPHAPEPSPSWTSVATTAVGTSIDATIVGVTLALVTSDISQTVLTIGVVTFMMTFIGLRLGSVFGLWAGRSAEALGGLGLIAIGANILFTHLTAG